MNGKGIRVCCGASTEERETRIALTKHADTFQLTLGLRKIAGATVFGDNQAAWREKRRGAKKGEDAAIFFGGSVGRIEENDVERSACGSMLRGKALQAPQRVELENACASADAQRIEILLNKGGSGGMVFDEHNFAGAAAEGLDADGAGAGEEVEEAAAGDAFGQDVEKGLAEAVAGGAKGKALEALELAAAKCSGDDAHSSFDRPQPT